MKRPIEVAVDYTLDNLEIKEWRKRVGDVVRRGEVLLEYETQKVVVEESAADDGVLCEITATAGEQVFRPDNVPSGAWTAIVGYIETEGAA